MTNNPFLNIPVIGLGMAALGRPEYINIYSDEREKIEKNKDAFQSHALEVLEYAYSRGIRYFDAAPGYGAAESFLHEWMKDKSLEKIVLGTKWGYTYVADWQLNALQHEIKEHSLSKLNEQWDSSKSLLPNLKVYQIHSATLESGVLENKEVLNQLAKLKHEYDLCIGLTTSGPQQAEVIDKALGIQINGIDLFDCFQVTYNILEQATRNILKVLKENRKSIIIKEALANGRIFPNKNYPNYNALYSKLSNISGILNVEIDAIALRYCMQTVKPDIILSGASNISQLKQNLKSLSVKLTSEEIEILNMEKVDSKKYWEERKKLKWN